MASATGGITVSQQSPGPPQSQFSPQTLNCLRCTVTTAQASVNANDIFAITQRVELQKGMTLFGIMPSLSLCLRPSVAGTYCVFIRDSGFDQSIVYQCVVPIANVWTRFPFSGIPILPTSVGNWEVNPTDFSFEFGVYLTGGATFQIAPANVGQWQFADRVSTSNQSNFLATNGSTLDICLAQLESSNAVSQFLYIPFDDQLRRSQRYFCKSYPYATAPAATDASAVVGFTCDTTSDAGGTVPFSNENAYNSYIRSTRTRNDNSMEWKYRNS
jgi:hypothetical protein